ncbi:MAG TPA: DUF167 domain-containing protein [Thermoanaerobaculia bacterium]|nr:DUF167 domain-containing protein [Thermoanaerobaculia bacterium]
MKTITVKVKPNARLSAISRDEDGTFTVRVKSPPTDGRANEELLALLARELGVAKSKLSIRSGAASRVKRVQIDE